MKTTDLIKQLQAIVATHGDLEARIESSHGEYCPDDIYRVMACETRHDGPAILMCSDEAEYMTRIPANVTHNALKTAALAEAKEEGK